MALFTNLINKIKSSIRSNEAQEITGNVLQGVLVDMTNDIGGVAEAAKEAAENISVTVDSELSLTSENPVQNKVITAAINGVKMQFRGEVTNLNMTPIVGCCYLATTPGTYSNFMHVMPGNRPNIVIELSESQVPALLYSESMTSWNAAIIGGGRDNETGKYLPLTGGVVEGSMRVTRMLSVGDTASQYNSNRNEISLINPNDHPVEFTLGSSRVKNWDITARNKSDNYLPSGLGLYNMMLGKYAMQIDKDNNTLYIGGINSSDSSNVNLYVCGNLSVGRGSLTVKYDGNGTKFLSDDGTYKAAGSALAAFRSFDGSMYASTGLSIDRSSAGVYNVSSTSLILTDYTPSVSILAGQAGFIVVYMFSASIIQVRTFNINGQPYDMGFYCGIAPTNIRFR